MERGTQNTKRFLVKKGRGKTRKTKEIKNKENRKKQRKKKRESCVLSYIYVHCITKY